MDLSEVVAVARKMMVAYALELDPSETTAAADNEGCYECGGPHLIRDCYKKRSSSASRGGGSASRGGGGKMKGKGRGRGAKKSGKNRKRSPSSEADVSENGSGPS